MSNAILLVIAGIILQVIDLPVNIGFMTINILSDNVAYILILLGLKPFLKEQNRLFSECFKLIAIALVAEIIRTASTCLDFGDSAKTVNCIFYAITSLMFMRFVYYYAECILLQGKFMKIELNITPIRNAFSAFCVFIAAHYLAYTFDNWLITTVANILLVICAVYYCSIINTCRLALYPPTKKAIED